ncbi:MAG: PAS domain-containing protein, partial [Chloroflexi bacterium]|nr:PAS domain-containing protein [Chloroflexota bacterium]
MSGTEVAAREAPESPAVPDSQGWLDRGMRWLCPYRPPFRDRRFWVVQGLVVLVAAVHTYAEAFEVLGRAGGFQPLYFVPSALFFIPVVYAALNFGLAGAVATALWSTFLTVPNWVVYHEGWDRAGCMFQVGVVDAIAVFVGQRVEREMSARRRAEAAGAALTASEMKYRGLFESSPVPILVLDPTGLVLEANPAAGALFGKGQANLKDMPVAELVGPAGAEQLLGSLQERG